MMRNNKNRFEKRSGEAVMGLRRGIAVFLAMCLLLTAAACSNNQQSGTEKEQTVTENQSGAASEGEGETTSPSESPARPAFPQPGGSSADTGSTAWELADGLPDAFDPGYSDRDREGSFDASEAVQVVLDDSAVQAGGAGVSAKDGIVTIQAAGIYVFNGSLSDGRICVDIADAGKDDKVQIVLDNVDITSTNGPAVWIKSADKVFLTLPAGTQNTLTDADSYSEAALGIAADSDTEVPNATVWSDCDLTINGSGSLTVTGRYNNGIGTKDDLVITGGTLIVTAANNGLKGKDSVAVCGGQITVTAGGDAVESDQDNSAEKGWISIDGGSLVLQAQKKGLSAQNDIYVTAGTITAGTVDDSVHANDSVHIAGGVLSLASQEKGIHADNILLVDGGQIMVSQCSEGMEAKTVTINGGEMDITASDDGINASDGSGMDLGGRGGFGQTGMAPTGSTGTEASSVSIEINGGILRIQAQGDGIDSNGTLTVNGGEVYVDGPTGGGDGALDYNGTASVTGGTVVAVGSAGMACNFTTAQNQCAWMVMTSSAQKAGSTLTVTDQNGTVLLTYTPSKDYQSIVVSCAGLTQGGTYTMAVDGTVLETATLTDPVTGSGVGMMDGRGGGFGGDRGDKPGREMPGGKPPADAGQGGV